MSESLLRGFQAQLSGLMEGILRSALVEITRLVESSFLEELGRGEQEADALKRRLHVLESKLSERERGERVRCADCGGTGPSKKLFAAAAAGQSRTQAGVYLDRVCITKQECISKGVQKGFEKTNVTAAQHETSTVPDTEPQTAEGAAAKVEGITKEEMTVSQDIQIYSASMCQVTDHRVPQGHSTPTGTRTFQPEHRAPQDSAPQRTHFNSPDLRSEYPVCPPVPSLVTPTRTSAPNSLDLLPMKQEVVVVLPSEWAEPKNLAPKGVQQQDLTPSGPSDKIHPVYPGTVVKKKPGSVSMLFPVNITNMKSTPFQKLTPTLQHFPRPYTEDKNSGIRALGQISGHHTTRMPRVCNHCGKTFSQLSHLKEHRRVHTGERPYSCTLCGNHFRRLWNLKLHQRIHTQEKPHRCTLCDKSFTRADILKIHQRTHTGERPYSCRICGLTFKHLDNLRSHQRKHTL